MSNVEWISRSALHSGHRSGFKSDARRRADRLRAALGLNFDDPLDTSALLAHLGLTLLPLSILAESDLAAWVGGVHLGMVNPSAFSGALLQGPHQSAVVVNDFHTPERVRATIAHEASHKVLGHTNTPFLTGTKVRRADAEVEREADFLGMCLLVPEAYVLATARSSSAVDPTDRRQVVVMAAEAMHVSTEMMQWAFNMSAAWKRTEKQVQ